MKKLFLLALAAASVSMVSAQKSNTTQIFKDGHKLSLEWVNTDAVGTGGALRTGIGVADKFYLTDYENEKLYIYDEKGLVEARSMKGMWVSATADKAGHALIRIADVNFPNGTGGSDKPAYFPVDNHRLAVIDPATDQVIGEAPMEGFIGNRFDVLAPVYGDVTDGFWELTIVGSGNVGGGDFIYNGLECFGCQRFPIPIDPAFTGNPAKSQTLGLAQVYGEDAEGVMQMAVYANAYTQETSSEKGFGNGIRRFFYGYDPDLDIDDEDNIEMWRPSNDFFVTPQHASNTGYYVFELCGKWYIVYTAGEGGGTQAPDAFAISEVKFTDTPLSDPELDPSALVARFFPATNEAGANAYKTTSFFSSFNVVPVEDDETSVYIYTYTAGAPMIKAKFTAPEGAGVDNIMVDSNVNAPIEYFNLEGVRVANPGNGIYIQRQGTKTTKVIF